MEYLYPPKAFLGLNITRSGTYPGINQSGHINRMLSCFQMIDAAGASAPLPSSLPLLFAQNGDLMVDQILYQETVGSLNLSLCTHDRTYPIPSQLSQFNRNPTETHIKAARHVLRYLKTTRDWAITYGESQIDRYSSLRWCELGRRQKTTKNRRWDRQQCSTTAPSDAPRINNRQ